MECADPAPLCSAWPDARLLQENTLFPLAEPGLGNESGESSPHSKPLGLTRGYDERIPYFPLAEPGLGNESGESSPHSKPLKLTRGYDERIPYFPLAEPGLGNESGESSPHSIRKIAIKLCEYCKGDVENQELRTKNQ